MTQDPAQTALQDQSDAALADAVTDDVLAKMVAFGGVTVHAEASPDDIRARQRFLDWTGSGDARQCAHRPLEGGQVTYWPLWRKVLLCVRCLHADHMMMMGTEDDRRCDSCGVVQPEGPDAIQSCSLAIQLKPEPGKPLIPPIIVVWGRCRTCKATP